MIVSRETLLQSIPVELPPAIPLTTNASSWLLHIPKFCRTPNRTVFQHVFQTHPPHPHALHLYGKEVLENRYSQMFVTKETVGSTYKYSGTARPCQVCNTPQEQPEQQFLLDLCHVSNIFHQKLVQERLVIDQVTNDHAPTTSTTPTTDLLHHEDGPYNCCLVNWYQPHHHIGLHADDERELNPSIPIVSLSWGGPRRFLLRPKPSLDKNKLAKLWWNNNNKNNKNCDNHLPYFEIELKDGDLLFMGGKCQQEFKHEIPKVRKTKDGLVGPRISWTIRSMIPPKTPKPHQETTPRTTAAGQPSQLKIPVVRVPVSKALGKRNNPTRDHEQQQGEDEEIVVSLVVGGRGDLGTATVGRRRRIG